MSELNVTLNNLGLINGIETWEVVDTQTGSVIGFNRKLNEEIEAQEAQA